jgi:hypothetical protein
MKKLFTLSLLAFGALTSNAQLPVSTQPQLKNTILEEFTGIHCQYCPDGHKIAAQIMANNPNRAFAVNIHTGGYATPGAGEPDLRTADGNLIAAMPGMGITGYPQGAVSRKLYGTGTVFALGRNLWTAATNTLLAQSAYVNVAGQATIDASNNQLTVNVEAYYTAGSPVATNKLSVMLLQNNINGPQTGAATWNPGMINPDGTYRHMHALRDVLTTGGTGEDISPTTVGTLITRTINYTIPASYVNVPVDLSNLELLVFVSETVSNVINVARIPITFTGLTTTNNAAVLNVVTEDAICVNSITPTFTLKNMGNATMTSAVVSYSINGGTASTYNWAGSLSALSSTTVTLPAISFTLGASNTLNINVTSVNGGTDDDPSNNTGSSIFTATTSASPTVNLTLDVVQDRYGSETTWKFFNAAGTQIAAGGPYADLAANGTLLHTHNVVVPASGCYRFVLYDTYGDGINGGYGVGSATIRDGYAATVYFSNGIFASSQARNFDVTSNLNTGITENVFVNNINIFPNPVQTTAELNFNLSEANVVNVKITNALGQAVASEKLGKIGAGSHVYTVDATKLNSGLYFIELEVGNSSVTRKISVNK